MQATKPIASSSLQEAIVHVNRDQILIATISLAAGLLVYLVARPAGSVWFLSAAHVDLAVSPDIRHAAGSLPTFTHTLAFSLLSAGVIASDRVRGAVICAAWFLIESAFEIGQRADVSPWLTARLPAWFSHVWLLSNSTTYFSRGTFDARDIIAAAAGAATACFIICHTQPQRQTS